MSEVWKKITVAFIYGGIAVLFACFLRFEKGETLKNFCDAFSFAGVGLLTIAGLTFLQDEGAFFGISYALKRTKKYLFPFKEQKRESYREYRKRKMEEEKNSTFVLCYLGVGLFYLAIACVLLLFYA